MLIQNSLQKRINQIENIPIRFHSTNNGLCTHNNTTLNSSVSYNLYLNQKPANPRYLSKNDINNNINFLNASIIGNDFNTCKLENNTILPLVGDDAILNINTALQYCAIFKDKCIGITSIDGNNIYWNLISKLELDSNNFNLVKNYRNTYIQDKININKEDFDNLNLTILNTSYINWTDQTAIIAVILILLVSVIIYYYYYLYVFNESPKLI